MLAAPLWPPSKIGNCESAQNAKLHNRRGNPLKSLTSGDSPSYHRDGGGYFGQCPRLPSVCDKENCPHKIDDTESMMAETKPPSSVKIFYEKGNLFRVIHVDGVLGGLTPSRQIFVSLYNQRRPLPKMVEQLLSADGKLGDVINRETKTGVFREMEIGLVLTSEAAQEIAKFLIQQAKMLDESVLKPEPKRDAAEKL